MIARLYYHKPKFGILDECTSAISLEMEHGIFQQAKGLSSKNNKLIFSDLGITLITIAHNKELRKHHTHLLRFDGAGKCSFGGIEDMLLDQEQEEEPENA